MSNLYSKAVQKAIETGDRLAVIKKLAPLFRFRYWDGNTVTRHREVDHIESTYRISNYVVYRVWQALDKELTRREGAETTETDDVQ